MNDNLVRGLQTDGGSLIICLIWTLLAAPFRSSFALYPLSNCWQEDGRKLVLNFHSFCTDVRFLDRYDKCIYSIYTDQLKFLRVNASMVPARKDTFLMRPTNSHDRVPFAIRCYFLLTCHYWIVSDFAVPQSTDSNLLLQCSGRAPVDNSRIA